MSELVKGGVSSRYTELAVVREPYLTRFRKAAALSISRLCPEDGHNATTDLDQAWQSYNSRCVTNLAAKLLLTGFPPARPFMRLDVEQAALEKEGLDAATREKLNAGLSKAERNATSRIYAKNVRHKLFEVLKHWLVGGNVIFYYPKDDDPRAYYLWEYVCKRSRSGELLELILCEDIDIQRAEAEAPGFVSMTVPGDKNEKIRLFTAVKRKSDGSYESWQELSKVSASPSSGSSGRVLGRTVTTYQKDELPWIVMRCNSVDAEDYGRSFVEDYLGDMASLDSLEQTLVQGSAAAARVLFGLKPGSMVNPKDLEKPSLSIIQGNLEEDVTKLHLDKTMDFRFVREELDELKQNLGYAFLLSTAIQRQAERVTAEEIRLMAQEIDGTNGGLYSAMNTQCQLPLARLELGYMADDGSFPRIPSNEITPKVITGFDALGRGQDYQLLRTWAQAFVSDYGPQELARITRSEQYALKLATALGVDTEDLVKTAEELMQERVAAQAQVDQETLMKTVGGPAAKAAMNMQQMTPTSTG